MISSYLSSRILGGTNLLYFCQNPTVGELIPLEENITNPPKPNMPRNPPVFRLRPGYVVHTPPVSVLLEVNEIDHDPTFHVGCGILEPHTPMRNVWKTFFPTNISGSLDGPRSLSEEANLHGGSRSAELLQIGFQPIMDVFIHLVSSSGR
jgi:hypothetical protein